MADQQTTQVLRFALEMLKRQYIYSQRLHGWIIAIAETLEKHPEIATELRQHPTYDQGQLPWSHGPETTIQNIDALIQQLSTQ
jgi:hypothetical protein